MSGESDNVKIQGLTPKHTLLISKRGGVVYYNSDGDQNIGEQNKICQDSRLTPFDQRIIKL